MRQCLKIQKKMIAGCRAGMWDLQYFVLLFHVYLVALQVYEPV